MSRAEVVSNPYVSNMTEHRRLLNLRVLGDKPISKTIMFCLWHIDRLTACEPVLEWLIKNNLTGDRFIEFVKTEFWLDGTPHILPMCKYLIQRALHDVEQKPIIGGKDYDTGG